LVVASRRGSARLREGLIDPNNTACDVWADTADRSQPNEDWLRTMGLARAERAIAFATMADNMKRWCWLNRKAAPVRAGGPQTGCAARQATPSSRRSGFDGSPTTASAPDLIPTRPPQQGFRKCPCA
jgi:hypothetical protein